MTPEDFRVALSAARLHGRAAMQALAQEHLPLVAMLARRMHPRPCEVEEMYQQGCVGLMKALLRFDPDQGVAFATYAVPVILGEMRQLQRMYAPVHIPRTDRELRGRIRRTAAALATAAGREPTIQELASALRMDPSDLMLLVDEVSVVSADAADDDAAPLWNMVPCADDWQSSVELRDLLSRLPTQDRELLRLRCDERLSQAEAGRRLGLTQVQVSRRETVLRHQLRTAWYAT